MQIVEKCEGVLAVTLVRFSYVKPYQFYSSS